MSDVYTREVARALEIVKENRHSSIDDEWFGPDVEPQPPGPDCSCAGCRVRVWGPLGTGLTDWQQFWVEHILCGGRLETLFTRKGGTRLVCSCRVERAQAPGSAGD